MKNLKKTTNLVLVVKDFKFLFKFLIYPFFFFNFYNSPQKSKQAEKGEI
jgi:hypothetical protein